MATQELPAPRETPRETRSRIALLRRRVEEGDYVVSADVVARDLLRHLGLAPWAELPQQR